MSTRAGRRTQGRRRRRDLIDFGDARDELVATAGDRDDVGMLVGAFVESPAQGGNVPGQGGVFDGDVAPDAGHELVLPEDATAGVDEGRENLEGLRRERNDGAIAPKQSFPAVGHERAELITAAATRLRGRWRRTLVDFQNFHNSSGATRDRGIDGAYPARTRVIGDRHLCNRFQASDEWPGVRQR